MVKIPLLVQWKGKMRCPASSPDLRTSWVKSGEIIILSNLLSILQTFEGSFVQLSKIVKIR